MPALSHFYPGITPPVVDLMTTRELSEYVTQMNRHHAEEREAARRNG